MHIENTYDSISEYSILANVDIIAQQIEEREKEELAAYQRRLQSDYDNADKHLQNTFQAERASIFGSREKRINDILCEKEKNSRKYISKIEILEREKQTYQNTEIMD